MENELRLTPKDIAFTDLCKDEDGFMVVPDDKAFQLLDESCTIEAEIEEMKMLRKMAFERLKELFGKDYRVIRSGKDHQGDKGIEIRWVDRDPRPEIKRR